MTNKANSQKLGLQAEVLGKDRVEKVVVQLCKPHVQNEQLITATVIKAKFTKGTGEPK